ncbi:hypothetical protein ACW5F0_12440 [Luteimonas sp. A534]
MGGGRLDPHLLSEHAGYGMASRFRKLTALAAVAIASIALACPAAAEEWSWAVQPYAWASSIQTDLRTELPPVAGSSEMEFRDILDKLDGSLQLHVEGGGARHGLFLDFTYLGISDSTHRSFADYEADLDTRLFEAAWVWSPGGSRLEGLDLFGGLRYLDADLKLVIEPLNPALDRHVVDVGKNYLDVMAGGRYSWVLSERWRLTARADGSFGDTEDAWNASLIAQYRTSNGAWVVGYRHLEIAIEDGGAKVDLAMSGPLFGYAFVF